MNIKKKILIHSLEQGYMVTDYTTGRKYAKETAEGVIDVIREALGIPTFSVEKLDQKQPEAITILESKTEILYPIQPIAPPVPESKTTLLQRIKELSQMKSPDGILIQSFKYDQAQAQRKEIEGYSNISVVELLDGRAMIQYKEAHYYTTKEKVMQIPYPTPRKYFKKMGYGFSSVAQTCLRAYRQYLANLLSADKSLTKNENEQEESKGSEDGTCDDVTFESCANNSPEKCKFCVNESRYEDKNKLAAKKPAPPLMKATIEP